MKLQQEMSLISLAKAIGAELQGDYLFPEKMINQLSNIEHAQEGDIAFLSNARYRRYLSETRASAVILTPDNLQYCETAALVTKNPRLSLAKFASLCENSDPMKPGLHASALIGDDCNISKSAHIGPNCVIGDHVTIGPNVFLGPGVTIGDRCFLNAESVCKSNVTLYSDVKIGMHCTIHSGTVIGSDGFGYAVDDTGAWVKMPHLGGVLVGDEVEIGANTSIDRGFMEDTYIGNNVIIDNLVQIAHNVSIGDRTAIAGCSAIAGSTSIGSDCLIGGGSSIAGHIEIGDKVHLTATTSVNRSLRGPGVYSSGFPAKENHAWRKNIARFQYLDGMAKRIRVLERLMKIKG